MAVAIIFVALFASAFGMYYLFITARNRERMGLIEKGADPSLFTGTKDVAEKKQRTPHSSVKFTLKSGMLIIGLGVGFIISFLYYYGNYPSLHHQLEGMQDLNNIWQEEKQNRLPGLSTIHKRHPSGHQ